MNQRHIAMAALGEASHARAAALDELRRRLRRKHLPEWALEAVEAVERAAVMSHIASSSLPPPSYAELEEARAWLDAAVAVQAPPPALPSRAPLRLVKG